MDARFTMPMLNPDLIEFDQNKGGRAVEVSCLRCHAVKWNVIWTGGVCGRCGYEYATYVKPYKSM